MTSIVEAVVPTQRGHYREIQNLPDVPGWWCWTHYARWRINDLLAAVDRWRSRALRAERRWMTMDTAPSTIGARVELLYADGGQMFARWDLCDKGYSVAGVYDWAFGRSDQRPILWRWP